jgi:excisionase family DNA binding protein
MQVMIRTNEPLLPPTDAGLPEWVRNGHLHSSSARPDDASELRPHLLTLTEAANQLRISPRTLRRMVESGKLTALRIGRQLRFDRDIFWREINTLGMCRD